jgi:hypothetical protein
MNADKKRDKWDLCAWQIQARGKRISKDEGRKDTTVSWKEGVIVETVHEDHHGPKGTLLRRSGLRRGKQAPRVA